MSEKRKYLKPVAWLGGRDLLANLKYFLLFAAFKGKLDPRDWMRPEVFPALEVEDEKLAESFPAKFDEGEFWFDYFADSGDGMTAGYALAYLCMSDLYARLPDSWDTLSPQEKRKAIDDGAIAAQIRSHLGADDPETVRREYKKRAPAIVDKLNTTPVQKVIETIESETNGVVFVHSPEPGTNDARRYDDDQSLTRLPRGAFLFVGGDTSYHVADFAGLGLRFQKVFDWAFEDLRKHLTEAAAKEIWFEHNRRPIFGVPGNHDYYDMIDGFNRQFAKPITRETRFINLTGRNLSPQLRLWPFKRHQTASYVAIRMPFGWWFWGVDSELNRVDLRQQEFFKRSYALSLKGAELQALKDEVTKNLTDELGEKGIDRAPTKDEFDRRFPRVFQTGLGNIWKMPSKLIVATSEPSTVEGRRGRPDEKTPMAFSFLDLTRPFLYAAGSNQKEIDEQDFSEREAIREEEKSARFAKFKCRLDISGDVHHYARYWGDASRPNEDHAASQESYASVVSGGGGASMSPTQTDYNEVEEQALYPSKEVSTRVVNKSLFNPWVVVTGGNIWLAGAIIAIIVYFSAGFPESHSSFTNSVMDLFLQGLAYLHLSSARAPHVTRLHGSLDGLLKTLEPLLLILGSIVSLIGAGLYMRWLFERLTKTYDWARERLLNIQLEGSSDEVMNERKENLYRSLLTEIEGQTSSVDQRRHAAFWVISVWSILLTILPFISEFYPVGMASRYVVLSLYLIGVVALFIGAWLASKHRYTQFAALAVKFNGRMREEKGGLEISELKAQVKQVKQFAVTPTFDYLPFWGLVLFPGATTFTLTVIRYWHLTNVTIPRFGGNTLILFAFVFAGTAAVVSMYYSKWLFDQSYRIKVDWWSYIPVSFLSTGTALALGFALWSFAQGETRFLIEDNLYLLVLLAVPIGCILLAMLVGNRVPKWPRRIAFSLIGIWHGILQIACPILLLWLGNQWAFVWSIGTVLAVAVICYLVLTHWLTPDTVHRFINRGLLPVGWVVYGLWMLLIPFWNTRTNPGFVILHDWYRLSIAGNLSIAGFVGALMSCVWLGWYFAVSLVFDGHANEAGSTARTEDYKQFIRFRVTKDTLTGFVISIDFPHAPKTRGGHKDGSTLKPRLVDVFTLRCGSPPEPG